MSLISKDLRDLYLIFVEKKSNVLYIQYYRKCTVHWWDSRTSNPVWGAKTVPGGFDSHALPPSNLLSCHSFLD